MGDRRLSITFGDYLTGGVPDGGPLWREGPALATRTAPGERVGPSVTDAGAADRTGSANGSEPEGGSDGTGPGPGGNDAGRPA